MDKEINYSQVENNDAISVSDVNISDAEIFENYSELDNLNAKLKSDKASSRKLRGGYLRKLYSKYIINKFTTKHGENIQVGKYVDFKVTDNATLEIGDKVVLGDYVHILLTKPNPHLYIGREVAIGRYSIISVKDNVSIGPYTLIGQNVQITDNGHTYDRNNLIKYQLSTNKPVKIGYDCWIGSGAKILSGVTIGNGCIIGANSVVTKDIPDYAVAVGCPARVIKYR